MKKIILTLLILFFIPLISSAATFGYTTAGGSQSSGHGNEIVASYSSSTFTGVGTILSISGSMAKTTSDGLAKSTLYDSSKNLMNPESEEKSINTTKQWYTFNITNGQTITSGNNYYISILGNTYVSYYYDSGGTTGWHYEARLYSNGFPLSSSLVSIGSYSISIYATYSTSSASTAPNSTLKINHGRLNINHGTINIR